MPSLLPFLGAIAGCHCWVPLGRNFGEVVVAAVPGRHCWVPLVDQTFGEVVVAAVPAGASAAAVPGCHCFVPLGRNFGEVVVAAVPGCHCWVPFVDHRRLARFS